MTDMIELAQRLMPDPSDDGFEPTEELRIFGVAERLEQRWRKPVFGAWGALSGWEYEWRAVPRVY